MKQLIRQNKLFLFCFLIFSASLPGQTIDKQQKITPDGTIANTYNGYSVDMNDNYAISGAPYYNLELNYGVGKAFIYRQNGATFEIAQDLESPVERDYLYFGWKVAIGEEFAFVSAPSEIGEGSGGFYVPGFVAVYKRNGDSWENTQLLFASDSLGGDRFGYEMDFDGKQLIVSSNPEYYEGEFGDTSGVYIFEYNGTEWVETSKFKSNEIKTDSDYFIGSVAISDDRFLVGYPNTFYVDWYSGLVYVFEKLGNTWQKTDSLTANDRENYDYFGINVDLQGDRAAVSSPYDDNEKGTNAGSAYIFKYDGISWDQQQKLVASDGAASDYLGYSDIKLDGDLCVVATPYEDARATNSGSVYIYKYEFEEWNQKLKLFPADGAASDFFGFSIDFNKNILLVGAPYDDDVNSGSGSNYFFELIARPGQVIATDGTYNNRTKISWENRSESREGYRIYRNDEEIGDVGKNTTSFFDYDAQPGQLTSYKVSAYNETWGNSRQTEDFGFVRPNGRIDGTITTKIGAGVKNVEMTIRPVDGSDQKSLQFDGIKSEIIIQNSKELKELNSFTIETWVNFTDFNQPRTIISADTAQSGGFLLQAESANNLKFTVFDYSSSSSNSISYTAGLQANRWYHVAVMYAPDTLILFVDGQKIEKFSATSLSFSPSSLVSIGSNTRSANEKMYGLISDARIWNKILPDSVTQMNRNIRLSGSEEKLLAYWPLTQTENGIVADYAQNGGHHGSAVAVNSSMNTPDIARMVLTDAAGDYSMRNLNYGELADFQISPYKQFHGFDPDSRTRTLDTNTPSLTNVNFTDTTSFSITGRITQKFNGNEAYVPDVELLVNDRFLGVKTDENGFFKLSIEESGIYTIRPRFNEHTFEPAEMTFDVQDDILDLYFEDTTRDTLSGTFLASCQRYIGQADLRIFNSQFPEAAFDTILTTNMTSGYYGIELPSREYNVEVVDFVAEDPTIIPNPQDVINYFAIQTFDLTDSSIVHNFVYRKPPQIRVLGLPEIGCAPFDIPIMEQAVKYRLRIEVYESFGEDTCLVDQGSIKIIDNVGLNAEDSLVLTLENGAATYELTAGQPNILSGGTRPYQKLIQIEADIDGEKDLEDIWVLIEGNRPREQTFATVSPELPMLILRDPPGDGSYSYLEKESTLSGYLGFSAKTSFGLKLYSEVKVGAEFFSGFGVYVPSSFWGAVKQSFGIEASLATQAKYELSFRNAEKFQTSGNQDITGEKGDVFMGAALNLIYALTDVITYDRDSCKVDESTNIIIGNDGFATTFIYTESHIRDVLIPQLQQLRDIYAASGSDSARTYANQINVWQETLALNQNLKQDAEFLENRSFSAGARYEASKETTIGASGSVEFTLEMERTVAVEAGFEVGGAGVSGGVETTFKLGFGVETGFSVESKNNVGYVFDDDDTGDFFSIDIKNDDVYGTPVFDLVSGRSSCPWEPGSQPRDGVQAAMDSYVRNDVDPNEKAAFTLFLGNTSQSDETRDYNLSIIQASNLDGAIISVGGVVIEDALSYTIPAGEQLTATLAVERGPLAYNYENLQVRLYAPCDPSIADTLNFSVNYVNPCSEVNLFRPEDGWLVNADDNDTLQVIINEYDAGDPNLENVSLQYRKKGENWKTAFVVQKNNLPDEYITYFWNVSALPNGDYDLRAVAKCGGVGVAYSPISKGTIDRSALVVFGKPQPSDGILNLGEDISVTFSEQLDCDALEPNNVRLRNVNGDIIEIETACGEKTLIINPQVDLSAYEGQTLTATVSNVKDVSGNILAKPVSWSFNVNQNPLYWKISNNQITIYQGESQSFEATLLNAGSQNTTFVLEQLPDWLTTTTLSGTIPPSGEQVITFNISNQLNQGTYKDSIIAITEKGAEVFIHELFVLAQPPQWIINPAQYAYNMNIITQLNIEGNASDDPFDQVAAFLGSDVRGKANIQFVSDLYGYMAFLTVYSNSASGENISFRGWDASEGNQYGAVDKTVVFENGKTIGSVDNPLILNPVGVAQTTPLDAGWTWIALNVENSDMSVNTVLQGINASDGDMIKTQNAFAEFTEGAGWIGSLRILKTGTTYLIRLKQDNDLDFIGRRIDPLSKNITINQGWNWIGYTDNRNRSLTEALQNFPVQDGDIIKSRDGFAEYDESSSAWLGSLQAMEAGKGYLLKSSTATVANFGLEKTTNSLSLSTITEGETEKWKVNPALYEYNMSLVANISFASRSPMDSLDLLAAFAGSECRGIARPIFIPELNRYRVFMTIFGNSADEEIELRLLESESGVVYAASKLVKFKADTLIGSVLDPQAIKSTFATNEGALPATFKIYQNYPNPFNPLTTIRYELPTSSRVKLTIYDILGKQVDVLVNERQRAGRYRVDYDVRAKGLSSGLYFYRFESEGLNTTMKMVLIK